MRVELFAKHLAVGCGLNITSFICMVWPQYYKFYLYGVVTILQVLFVWCGHNTILQILFVWRGHNITSFICMVWLQYYRFYLYGVFTILQVLFV